MKSRHHITKKVSVIVWEMPGEEADCYTAVMYGPDYTFTDRFGNRAHHGLGLTAEGRYYWLELRLPDCDLGRRVAWDKLPQGVRDTIEAIVFEE